MFWNKRKGKSTQEVMTQETEWEKYLTTQECIRDLRAVVEDLEIRLVDPIRVEDVDATVVVAGSVLKLRGIDNENPYEVSIDFLDKTVMYMQGEPSQACKEKFDKYVTSWDYSDGGDTVENCGYEVERIGSLFRQRISDASVNAAKVSEYARILIERLKRMGECELDESEAMISLSSNTVTIEVNGFEFYTFDGRLVTESTTEDPCYLKLLEVFKKA